MIDQLEEIKSKIDIVSFISEYLSLKKAGRNFKVVCPFHSEKTPSFVVSPERQIWHCFGACNDGGDIFKFLMRIENLEFPEALQILAKRAGVQLVATYQANERAKLKEKIFKINHLASEFYHYLLLNHRSGKQALDYVLGRGVSKKSIETFSLGWAPNLWDSLIRFLTKKGYTLSDLEIAGLVVRKPSPVSYYDRFRGRVMFTLRDHRGNVVGFSGRTLDPQVSEAKYINTPETPVYIKGNVLYGLEVTREAIKKEDKVVIVEGEFDLISSFQAGVANVVAIKGSALTEGQVNLLKRFTQNVILALDTDLAGDAAARRGIEMADAVGLSSKVVELPSGKDPDECIRINPNLWRKTVKEAIPIFDYFLDSAFARHGREGAEGKRKIGEEVLPILSKISNPIVQAHYFSKLANLLSVSEEVIVATAKKIAKEEKTGSFPPVVVPQGQSAGGRTRDQLLEENFLALLLQSEDPQEAMSNVKCPRGAGLNENLASSSIKKIFKLLIEYLALPASGKKSSASWRIGDFVKSLPPELAQICDLAYLIDLGEILDDKKLFLRELEKTMIELKKSSLKKHLLSLVDKMREAKRKELVILTEEYRQVAAELKKCQTSEL